MAANGSTAGSGAFMMAESLSGERPKTTLSILQNRSRRTRLVAESLALYLQERTDIEDAYVKGLQKLQRKPIISDSYGLHLGPGLDRIRKRLDSELEESVQLHEQFSQKLDKEVVNVLREKSKVGESALKSHDTAAAPLVKDWDDMKARLEKLQGKGGSQNAAKIQVAKQDIAEAQNNWRSNVAPQLFTAYDKADRARIEGIKESLAKYATMQNDLGRESMDVAARVLNDVIVWELDEDVSDWLRAEGGGRGGVIEGLGRGTGSSRAETTPSRPRNDSFLSPAAAAASTPGRPGSIAERAPSVHSNRNERSGGGGFLSKLRPNLNRQRSSSKPDAYGNIDATNADRSSVYSAEPAPEGPTALGQSVASRASAATEEDSAADMSFTSSNDRSDKRRSFMPGLLKRKNSTAQDKSFRGGKASQAPSSGLAPPVDADNEPVLSDSINSTPRPSMVPQPDPPAPARVDAEGFNVPPAGHDKQPWEATGGASLMDDDDGVANLKTSSMAIQPSTVAENPAERQAALDKVKSTLLSTAPQGSVARRGTTRDRRAVRSTMYASGDDVPLSQIAAQQPTSGSVPSALTGVAAGGALATGAVVADKALSSSPTETAPPQSLPVAADTSSALPSASFTGSPFSSPLRTPATSGVGRSMSMMSSSSSNVSLATGAGLGVFANPNGEGLRAFLSETVQVLARGGNIERIMVTGEIALLLRTNATAPLRVRVTEHAQLEKSAPNNAFFTPAGQPGEFMIDTTALASASVSAPVAVFRYHLNVPRQHDSDLPPVHVHPQWKCEPTQTSILVNYRAVPSSRLAAAGSASPFDDASHVTLRDLSLQIPVTSSTVGGVQTKPQGSYLSDKRLLRFNLADLDIASTEQHKVLARLAVGEQSQVQPITLRYTVAGKLVSGLNLELIYADGVKLEEVVKVTNGKHLAS